MAMTSARLMFAVSLCILAAFTGPNAHSDEGSQAPVPQQDGTKGRVQATLLVNSGEPDPSWELGGAALKTVRDFLKDLPPARRADWQQPVALGYRGIRLTNDGITDFPSTIHVYQGVMEIRTGDKIEYFKVTKGKDLEKFLLDLYEKGRNTM